MTALGLRRISDKKLAAIAGLLILGEGKLTYLDQMPRTYYGDACGCSRCSAYRFGIRNASLPTQPFTVVREMQRRLRRDYTFEKPTRAHPVKAR